MALGPPIPVYRYTEYRDTAVNIGGIDTGIVLSNTVVFGIGNSGSQQRHALQAPPPYNVRVAPPASSPPISSLSGRRACVCLHVSLSVTLSPSLPVSVCLSVSLLCMPCGR